MTINSPNFTWRHIFKHKRENGFSRDSRRCQSGRRNAFEKDKFVIDFTTCHTAVLELALGLASNQSPKPKTQLEKLDQLSPPWVGDKRAVATFVA